MQAQALIYTPVVRIVSSVLLLAKRHVRGTVEHHICLRKYEEIVVCKGNHHALKRRRALIERCSKPLCGLKCTQSFWRRRLKLQIFYFYDRTWSADFRDETHLTSCETTSPAAV